MKILVPLDGSARSEAILPHAEVVARGLHAEVHLMTVVHPPRREGKGRRLVVDAQYPTAFAGTLGVSTPTVVHGRVQEVPVETREQAIARLEHEADEYLLSIEKRFQGLKVVRHVRMAEDPVEPILEYAREIQADMLALSTHGRTGLAAVVQGSVAGALIRSRVAPVLVYRPADLKD
ncbi:MAG: universal stress protein [Dehalococcoidia bacterium]|nr:universal stress protein [Dehalococcoidia bacterium]